MSAFPGDAPRTLAQQLGVQTDPRRRQNLKSGHVRPGARAKRDRQDRAYARGGTLPIKKDKYA